MHSNVELGTFSYSVYQDQAVCNELGTLEITGIHLMICYHPCSIAKEGDNALGSVCLSVHLFSRQRVIRVMGVYE